jgi:CubicO group peptidase (beta-lactamase class C family)
MRLREAMAERVTRRELPGLVMVLARESDVVIEPIGQVAFDEDAESGAAPSAEPMRRDTVFRIASCTKPIVAAAAMAMVEDGVLALDAPIERWLPEMANRRVLRRIDGPLDDTVPAERPITVEDVLTFRMGYGMITEPSFEPPYPITTTAEALHLVMGPPDPRTPHAPDEWIKLFATLPLMYQPGTRWQYNASALVLGVLLARADGKPLGDVLRTRIFEPLGMTSTGFFTDEAGAARMPAYYASDMQGGPVAVRSSSPADMWTSPPVFPAATAGLLSTADDFLAFARMLQSGGGSVLSPESVRAMTTNHLTPEQIAAAGLLLDPKGWGYGMAVGEDGRYGWDGGSGCVWFNDPERDLIAFAFTQTSDFLFAGGRAEFRALATDC